MAYDCVWWWRGGTENGEWMRADAGTRDDIRRMGYAAFDGSIDVGPPDAPPVAWDRETSGRRVTVKRA